MANPYISLRNYDWYADLPPASPQIWGEQTDVPESSDWYNSGYIMMWGSNIPMTRTPDAHFMTEVRYKGTKVVTVSPDYAENVKFADDWLAVNPGEDAALALVDDHAVVRDGLNLLLSAQPDLVVVGEAAEGNEALRKIPELEVDVVVMDLSVKTVTASHKMIMVVRMIPIINGFLR